jgi:hypothetical protein
MAEAQDAFMIGRLQARYADVVTRRAWPELGELFLDEARIEIDTGTAPTRTVTGPAAFGEFVAHAVERFDHFTFVILNAVVEVHGDQANGRMFICEVRHDREADAWCNAHGVYEDRYRRVRDRWWFAARHYRSMARTGPDAAVVGLPDGSGPISHLLD